MTAIGLSFGLTFCSSTSSSSSMMMKLFHSLSTEMTFPDLATTCDGDDGVVDDPTEPQLRRTTRYGPLWPRSGDASARLVFRFPAEYNRFRCRQASVWQQQAVRQIWPKFDRTLKRERRRERFRRFDVTRHYHSCLRPLLDLHHTRKESNWDVESSNSTSSTDVSRFQHFRRQFLASPEMTMTPLNPLAILIWPERNEVVSFFEENIFGLLSFIITWHQACPPSS